MISIVVPVRNRARLVKRTLDSISEQTLTPDAVILVNNGSTDSTRDVLQRWADEYNATAGENKALVIDEPRPGASIARNAGLARVESRYVMFFDSDDVMPPRHVEEVTAGLQAASMPQIGVFDMEISELDGRITSKPYRTGDPMAVHIFHSSLATLSYAVNTAYARRAGGWNESLRGWDDLEFGVRLLHLGARPAHLPLSQPVKVYAQSTSQTGTDFSSKAGQWERALDACAATVRGTRYERLVDYRRAILAGTYCREGHPELARGLAKGLRLKLIARYVAAGGRGVAHLSRLFR